MDALMGMMKNSMVVVATSDVRTKQTRLAK